MTLSERAASFFAPLRRDAWLFPVGVVAYLGVSAVAGFYQDLGDLAVMVVLTCILIPSSLVPVVLAYGHLWPRWIGVAHPLSPRALVFHAVVIYGGVRLGGIVPYQLFRLGPEPFSSVPFQEYGDAGLFLGLGMMTLGAASMTTLNANRGRIHQLEVRALEAKHQQLSAQLSALQSRLNPHFLFNSLNTLACLIAEQPRVAEKMVERLAELLRYTLGASAEWVVPLADELKATEHYLELEALRFGDHLKVAFHLDPNIHEASVPPLILQPLVENAILHGASARVEVTARREGDLLLLSVEDDGPGPGTSSHEGSGSALRDMRQRLALLYGEAARLEIGRGALGGYRACIVVPVKPVPSPAAEARAAAET